MNKNCENIADENREKITNKIDISDQLLSSNDYQD